MRIWSFPLPVRASVFVAVIDSVEDGAVVDCGFPVLWLQLLGPGRV